MTKANEGLIQDVLKVDFGAAGQSVLRRYDKDELVRPERERFQRPEIDRISHDAKIGKATLDRGHDLTAWPLFEIDVDCWIVGKERS